MEMIQVQLGIDVLHNEDFASLRGARVGLITNHTGVDGRGTPTIDLLFNAPDVELVALFSPEHGIRGVLDDKVPSSVDETTGLPIHSLYGETRRPTADILNGIDALVFDIQDVGARFYTYTTTMAYTMEAAAVYGLRYVVLDRPNPIGGVGVEGPMVDDDQKSFVGYIPIPVRHGMTVGELARYFQGVCGLEVNLTVVAMQGWRRTMWFDETGLTWRPTSPAMRTLTAAAFYPGVCLLERMNVSVGRGTDKPFEQLGAPWIEAEPLAEDLNERQIPGVTFKPVEFSPTLRNFTDEVCHGVELILTDRHALPSVEMGIHLIDAIHRQNPVELRLAQSLALIGSRRVVEQLLDFERPADIIEGWQEAVTAFKREREKYLLYTE
jgi:uncharacterized protein YbbC (DUF1343 family)